MFPKKYLLFSSSSRSLSKVKNIEGRDGIKQERDYHTAHRDWAASACD
ncbi:MAG: hypothetical protein KME31_35450 [Tolypothrix carrinoi HA7290-LM1]|nr:hypothetical protein [Tolypothrix carrinoi HA7290-LM1]